MMKLLGLFGIIASFFMVKYRERIGEMLGDPEWAGSVGGIYNVIVIMAIILMFWGITALTGTGDVLLNPIMNVMPGGN